MVKSSSKYRKPYEILFYLYTYIMAFIDVVSMQLVLDTTTTVDLTQTNSQEYIDFKGKIEQSVRAVNLVCFCPCYVSNGARFYNLC